MGSRCRSTSRRRWHKIIQEQGRRTLGEPHARHGSDRRSHVAPTLGRHQRLPPHEHGPLHQPADPRRRAAHRRERRPRRRVRQDSRGGGVVGVGRAAARRTAQPLPGGPGDRNGDQRRTGAASPWRRPGRARPPRCRCWRRRGPRAGATPSDSHAVAAAAAALAKATEMPCETLAKLDHDLTHSPGSALVASIRPGTLVVIDEAGMADTLTLDPVITYVGAAGRVRLVGDDQQLAAIGAGGVLRDIATTHGALRLDELVRFTDPAEAVASLDLRDGDPAADRVLFRSRARPCRRRRGVCRRSLRRVGERACRRPGLSDAGPNPRPRPRAQRARAGVSRSSRPVRAAVPTTATPGSATW